MCSNCGFPEVMEYWADAGNKSAHDRIRSRLNRANKLQTILRKYRLLYYDNGVNPYFQIGNLTGRVELVMDMEQLWAAAEDLLGKAVDPLKSNFF
jgi:hypothetical protein